MRKIFLIPAVLAAFVLPTAAQTGQSSYPDELVQIGAATIKTGEIPSSVVKAVNTRFDKDNPATWSKFPHSLKEYGWLYEFGNSETPLSNYEVTMKTSNGLLKGVYNTAGELTQTSETSKNIQVPQYIMKALFESQYKDWKVVGNKEVVNFFNEKDHSIATQSFKLKVENGKETKRLAFDYDVNTGKLEARVIR